MPLSAVPALASDANCSAVGQHPSRKGATATGTPPSSTATNGLRHEALETPLDASLLKCVFTTQPRSVPVDAVAANVGIETLATDHMVTISWRAGHGWAAPELRPYGALSLMPTASCLHYATECFEGLKVYRGFDGRLRMFRSDLNAARMCRSATHVSLPSFDPAALLQLMAALLAVDGPRWLPRDPPGDYLYLRPTLIGTQPQLGVQISHEALLYVILTFMPCLDRPPGGMRLHTSPPDLVRAWVGGFGYAKLGANYGPTLQAMQEVCNRGLHQILWLYSPSPAYSVPPFLPSRSALFSSCLDPVETESDAKADAQDETAECTEAGASNFFIVWRRPGAGAEDRPELLTAPLDDKLILDGVARRSCLELARERLGTEVDVAERKYTIGDLLRASAERRLLEAFAAGTAFFICPVSHIQHRDIDISISIGPDSHGGPITSKLKTWIGDIMYGLEDHSWGVVIDEKE